MKLKKLIFFIWITALLSLMQSCKKGDPEYYNIPNDFKQWVVYQPGTYWIYLNEKTGVQDCTFVTSSDIWHHVTGDPGSSDIERHYEVNTTNCSGSLFRYMEATAGSTNTILSIPLVRPGSIDIAFSYALLLNPQFINNSNYVDELSREGVKQVYPLENINGKEFTNVYDLRHEWINYKGDSLVTEAHFAKNTGIIKLRIYEEKFDTTWSLIRYNIVQ